MALSDCPKCWDTPCICGWEYRNWSKAKLTKMRDMFQALLDGSHEYSKEIQDGKESDSKPHKTAKEEK